MHRASVSYIISTQKSKEQTFSLINLCIPMSIKCFMIMSCSLWEVREVPFLQFKKKNRFLFKSLGWFKVWVEAVISHDRVCI